MVFLSRAKNLCLFIYHGFLDFLFPKSQKTLALEALNAGDLLELLPLAPLPPEKNTFALFDYSHQLVKEIVWEIKYGGNRNLAEKMGAVLYDTILSELREQGISLEEQAAILLPMPISGKRRFERGWNQAELLAEAVKKLDAGNHFKYFPGQLIKIRHTESQTRTASKYERKTNLSESMKVVHQPSLSGRMVVLIDDVVTTGSTFAEAKRALRKAGVQKIFCFAIAH